MEAESKKAGSRSAVPPSDRTAEGRGENFFWNLGMDTIKRLETDHGLLASSREEIFGAIFGRDSLIACLELMRVYEHTRDAYFLHVVRKALLCLMELQGKDINQESGEEPGKCIHEFRPDNHERLTSRVPKPWYLYPDAKMRNYDSVDATPLFLIALRRYLEIIRAESIEDRAFGERAVQAAEKALRWIFDFGDKNDDGFIDFALPPTRIHGGLLNQHWMDSGNSIFHESGEHAIYPIAPVEVQAYTYAALAGWASFFRARNAATASLLSEKALRLKERFNRRFIAQEGPFFLFSGVDGDGKPLRSIRSNMGHALWASYRNEHGETESILESSSIEPLVRRLMEPDLFEPSGGIRTLSTTSVRFNPKSYHNGSLWPHDTAMVALGMENFGYTAEAEALRKGILHAITYFQTPIELFSYTAEEQFAEYRHPDGTSACKLQAWSAAAILGIVSARSSPKGAKTAPLAAPSSP